MYSRDDAGSGGTFWWKQSRSDANGWQAVAGVALLNVKDFGAVGDGATDDTAGIKAALKAADDGSTVYFPPGVYSVFSGINVTGCKIMGEPGLGNSGPRSVIRAHPDAQEWVGGLLFSGKGPNSDPGYPKRARPPVNIKSLFLNANRKAEHGLYLYGAAGLDARVSQLTVNRARLDNVLLDNC